MVAGANVRTAITQFRDEPGTAEERAQGWEAIAEAGGLVCEELVTLARERGGRVFQPAERNSLMDAERALCLLTQNGAAGVSPSNGTAAH